MKGEKMGEGERGRIETHHAPPPVPSIHRRSSSSASRESSSIPHLLNPSMNIDRPPHLQRRASSRPQRSTKASSSPKRPPRSRSTSRIAKVPSAAAATGPSRTKRIPRHSKSYQSYTFQHPRHSMSVSIRPSPPNRISFLPSPHPTSASLQSLLNDMERIRGSRLTTSSIVSAESSNPCRISPSPGGVKIWEIMTKMRNQGGRQLCWKGVNGSDPWYDPLDSTNHDMTTDSSKKDARYTNSHQYTPINPYHELAKLPSHSPILTNYKRRLPNRADVGFANPTEEEIRLKMAEVQKECEWQECSPRICLLTGFGLLSNASSRRNTECASQAGEEDGELNIPCRQEMEAWNGGRIPGMPYAGRDLIDCYKMYQHFEREYNNNERTGNSSDRHQTIGGRSKTKEERDKLTDPRTYSIFAPPLDAVPSKSNLWKPRPFNDRPAGMRYLLACPCDLRGVGDDEPLFCTMALYLLPGGECSSSNNQFKGKISEDFFFPAGNWNTIEEGQNEEQSWRRRKRRAVFSYDPLDCEEGDLFLVVQVFRVARCTGVAADEENDSRKKGLGSKIKGTFKKSRSRTDMRGDLHGNDLDIDLEQGPRFLSPLCFSAVPAFPIDDPMQMQQWPVGETMRAPLYASQDGSETQDDFVGQLSTLTSCQRGEYSSPTGKNFRSYSQITMTKNLVPMQGHFDIFSSFVGQDFTRVLLQEPPELSDLSCDEPSTNRPLLLTDVMGESAIGFDGETPNNADSKSLRSKMRRLPPTPSSGYTCSFDIKEILYMPPRVSPRKYEEDAGLNTTTFLNLLYVYPRLIRSANGLDNVTKLSLRVRVVEQELHEQSFDGDEAVYHPLQSIYNASSPAGPPMVESFHTKLVSTCNKSESKSRRDVLLKDEIKIRLPNVVDRRHFLEFSLFAVNYNFESLIVAETTVPFIISSKESTAGGRVTTIIPNGLHRIQLGENFQIHIETRLASSIHVSDPAVATIVRDCPIPSFADSSKHLAIAPFVEMLNMASGQAIKRHFLSLMTLQLLCLSNQPCPLFYYESLFDMFGSDAAWHRLVAWKSVDSLVACIRALFEILEKTKTCFLERDQSVAPAKFQQWIKSLIDSFDEKIYVVGDSPEGDENNIDEYDPSVEGDISFELGYSLGGDSDKEANANSIPEIKPNLSMISRSSSMIRSPRKSIPSAVFEAPFSRKAFVATRFEQMQADAELLEDSGGNYFDDDQTVVTFATTVSKMTFATLTSDENKAPVNPESKSSLAVDSSSKFSYSTPPRRSLSNSNDFSSTPFSFASKRAEYMANRVNTMAQLVMAPCIAPSLPDGMSSDPNLKTKHASSNGNSKSKTWQSNKNPVEPGSDAEEEGQTKSFISLRGNQSCLQLPPLKFHLMTDASAAYKAESVPSSTCLYERLTSLWVHSWTSFAAQLTGETYMRGSTAAISLWPYEVIQGSNNPSAEEKMASSFIRNIPFILPLILKSLAVRCSKCQTTPLVVPMTFLDDAHMQILTPLFETIALGTMREATSGSSRASNANQMLAKALSISQYSMDFAIGLFACLHPSQVATLISAYINMLEECEIPIGTSKSKSNSADKHNLRRVKCARVLRLHAVEKLATMPRFVALNYPPKYTGHCPKKSSTSSNSAHHSTDKNGFQICLEQIDRYPQSFWLSHLLMSQCISISLRCCKSIITEAKSQLNTGRYGSKPSTPLTQEDLLGLEAIAFQSAACARELLMKRHAMDSRFQSVESNTRVAALFVDQILGKLVHGISILTRLEPNQKVRTCWILSLLYVLQEAPEALLRDKLRSFCQQDNFHIYEFLKLLTAANVTMQHLMIPSSDWFGVFGGKAKELIQESFSCLSASVILVVDECVDEVIADANRVTQLAKTVFGTLLHLLATPQSSVTLLRTLGSAAHAFDKFGASVFMRVVGNDLQNWGRVILTLMNSTELSVRSMAVDFIVSLLGGVYNKMGNVDDISLVFLTVLPEVSAREIALYSLSGLTKTMDDVEVTLWPIRRAFADIEETDSEDDDRIDAQLMPLIVSFCRTGQAILDSVLVEFRLNGFDPSDIRNAKSPPAGHDRSSKECLYNRAFFDADEESVLEAATFFAPESSMPQKVRYFLILRDLHISKSQWVEAAETLILTANSIIDSLPHLVEIWRPWPFDLWSNFRLSPWLTTVGLSNKLQALDNEAVIKFAGSFVQSPGLVHSATNCISIETVCATLSIIVDQAFLAFDQEGDLQDLAYAHFDSLLSKISRMIINEDRKFRSQDISHLRRARATICAKLVRLDKDCDMGAGIHVGSLKFVRVVLRGRKPLRFQESTTLPTYFEWNMPSICRVPLSIVAKAKQHMSRSTMKSEDDCVCAAFAEEYMSALKADGGVVSVILRIGETSDVPEDDPNTFLDVSIVQMKHQTRSIGKSRKFFSRGSNSGVVSFGITEYTVAHKFPHVLSRSLVIVSHRPHGDKVLCP